MGLTLQNHTFLLAGEIAYGKKKKRSQRVSTGIPENRGQLKPEDDWGQARRLGSSSGREWA